MQVDAVHQWPGQAPLIALRLLAFIAAALFRITQVAAGAGVHRRHQLKTGRERHLLSGPGDVHLAGFQGLAQYLQHPGLEFR